MPSSRHMFASTVLLGTALVFLPSQASSHPLAHKDSGCHEGRIDRETTFKRHCHRGPKKGLSCFLKNGVVKCPKPKRYPKGVISRRRSKRYKNPLDKPINVRITNRSVQSYLDQISAQTNVYFFLEEGVERCRLTAFLQNVPARKALSVLLETGGITYQQKGKTNHYVVSSPPDGTKCFQSPPKKPARGSCRAGMGLPITLSCTNGPYHKFAEIIAAQTGTNFVLMPGAENYPITAQLEDADFPEALEALLNSGPMTIQVMGKSKIHVISPRDRAARRRPRPKRPAIPKTKSRSVIPQGRSMPSG